MFLDIKLGIFWAFFVGILFEVPLTPLWFLAGVLFALLPDLDFWIEYARRGTVGGTVLADHRTLLHNPLLYVPVALLVGAYGGDQWMALFVLGVLGHFIHDSLGMGFGVRWLWPISASFYKVFSDKQGNIFYDRKHLRITSWTPQEVRKLLKKKGNDRWLAEDIAYHRKHWREHAVKFSVFFVVMLLAYGILLRLERESVPERTKAQVLPAKQDVCALPDAFLSAACTNNESVNLKGRDLVAPDRVIPRPPRPAPLPFYEKYVPVPEGQNPNSVRLQKSQVPPPYAGAKVVNGQFVCGKKDDKPRESKKNKDNHIDMECCLDPDEVPNPYCTY